MSNLDTKHLVYKPKNKVRFVTAASLFDGHDASINIMRRILQGSGCEVIHLGHNRSVKEVVDAALQEDAHGIALSSYQGGHVEYFKYMIDMLKEAGASHIKVFGGGGGVIVPAEIKELHAYGVARIFSPEDGARLGLQGMINDMIAACDQNLAEKPLALDALTSGDRNALARWITMLEAGAVDAATLKALHEAVAAKHTPTLGITGTGGAGKSSLTDELVRRFRIDQNDALKIAIISIDPSRRKSGGALLGDRIRMNAINHDNVYMRSLATRDSGGSEISKALPDAIAACKLSGFDAIFVETSGIGQGDAAIVPHVDATLYVMTPEFGAASQLEKIDMLDFADFVAINKFDRKGAQDALRDVRKQVQRNKEAWSTSPDQMPVFGTMASRFADDGVTALYQAVAPVLVAKSKGTLKLAAGKLTPVTTHASSQTHAIVPAPRARYLAEIADTVRGYHRWTDEQARIARERQQLAATRRMLTECKDAVPATIDTLIEHKTQALDPRAKKLLDMWPQTVASYAGDEYIVKIRDKEIRTGLTYTSLSGTKIRKVVLPRYEDDGEILKWQLKENVPGSFPFTAGVFAFKRENEDPTRMFAGEGDAFRTNRRFKKVSEGMPAKRLSTAFDSVTLYGNDPAIRPDIYGKVGNSGVSIATVEDMKVLYDGFDLCAPNTSVSMTINGPAPTILAFFMNTAMEQQLTKFRADNSRPPTDDELAKIKAWTLENVRGTVQADILKEDQAQNTCIFSTEFALKLMGDVQEYFIHNKVRNFYSVSISGYHIAEAGANPITQLAFTLSNGFTYVEYYLSRGMNIDDFAPNLSFFFSNGMDPEYSVIGRVARRIWAKAMKYKYKANNRSQKLKYHIQTSGRSLHAQEIDFNDIRTTLQALYAIYDNCNSLHTNAYDEAITTPTEESVRRAMAIQLIINRELGSAKTENFIQGSFIIEALTNLVEEAVMVEFDRITERGGVLGAMERMYQRSKIQEESLYYETLKHDGKLPIIGVNTFLGKDGSKTVVPEEVIRSSETEREYAIQSVTYFQQRNESATTKALHELQSAAISNGNIFEALMEGVKNCSLGQISGALYQVGGQYRRNM